MPSFLRRHTANLRRHTANLLRQQTYIPHSPACYSQRREHTSSFQRRRTAWGVAFLRWLQTERAVVPLDYVLNVGGFNLEKVDDDVTCC